MKSILGGLLFDRKPVVPEFNPIDVQAEQQAAIGGNIAALPNLEELASKVNAYSIDELQKGLEKMFPGYSERVKKAGSTIDSYMRGEVPADVVRNLRQYAAESGATQGTGQSFTNERVLKSLGLTSLGLVEQGLSTAERWINQARASTPQFNFTSMFVTPAQQIATQQWNKSNQWNRNWLANQIKAMPEGWEQAVQGLLDWVATSGSQVVSAYAGGGGPGMGGGAGGGGGGGPYGGGSSWG